MVKVQGFCNQVSDLPNQNLQDLLCRDGISLRLHLRSYHPPLVVELADRNVQDSLLPPKLGKKVYPRTPFVGEAPL